MKHNIQKGLQFLSLVGGLLAASTQSYATLMDAPLGSIPEVHRHDSELHVLGDFDNDGVVDDWMLIDRETGMANIVQGMGENSVYVNGGYANITKIKSLEWYRIYVGLDDIDDAMPCAVKGTVSYGTSSSDVYSGLAVSSSLHNRVVLTYDPGVIGRNFAAASVGRVLDGMGPTYMVSQGMANVGASSGNDSLFVVCENYSGGSYGPFFECLPEPAFKSATTQTNLSINGEQWRDLHSVFDANHFFALRELSDSTELLMLESGPDAKELAIIKSQPKLMPDAQITFGNFSGVAGRVDCIFWTATKATIQLCKAELGLFDNLAEFELKQAPRFITSIANSSIFVVVYEDDTAAAYRWDGDSKPEALQDLGMSKNGGFLGVISFSDGSMCMVEGQNGASTHLRQFAFMEDGSGFVEQDTIELPQNVPTGARGKMITAEAYVGDPFEPSTAQSLEAYRFGDWATGYFTSAGSYIGVQALSFYEDEGLQYPFSSSVNVPANFENLLFNQYDKDRSAYLGEGMVGPVGPSVAINPGSQGGLSEPFRPSIIATQPNCKFYYRMDGATDWTLADSELLPQIVDDAVVEVFAKSEAGVPGSVVSCEYRFLSDSASRDSDNDGVPDAIEKELGLDPTSGADADGDGYTDLAELVYELDQLEDGISYDPSPAVNPETYPSEDYPVAMDVVGKLDLDVTVDPLVAMYEKSRAAFVEQATGFDYVGFGTLASGEVLVGNLDGVLLGQAGIYGLDTQFEGLKVSSHDPLVLVETGRSSSVRPVLRPSHEDFESGDGGWTLPDGSVLNREPYGTDGTDHFLEVTGGAFYPSAVNAEAEWIGDLSGDGIGGIRLRVCNLDPLHTGHIRVVLGSNVLGIKGSYWCSLEEETLASAKKSGAPDNEDAWHEVVFTFDAPESYTDANSNGVWDEGEAWDDANGDGAWTAGNFIRVSGGTSFEDTLAEIDVIKIINSDQPAAASTSKLDGFGLDKIRFEDTQRSAPRLLAAVEVPDFSHEFVPFEPDESLSFYENLAEWNAERESVWSMSEQVDVAVDVSSTLTFILFEYAMEQALENIGAGTASRRLGNIRELDELLPLSARDVSLYDPDTTSSNLVTFETSDRGKDNKHPAVLNFGEVEASGKVLNMITGFAEADKLSAHISFDSALNGEYFTVNLQRGIIYRGQFSDSTNKLYELPSPESLGLDDLSYLYFPSVEGGYAPSGENLTKAVDPQVVLEYLTEAVEINASKGGSAYQLAEALYLLNSALCRNNPGSFEDPVRALRGFVREGLRGLGGPGAEAEPGWRAALEALGMDAKFCTAAKTEMDKLLGTALKHRPITYMETMTLCEAGGLIYDRVRDDSGDPVLLVDKSGELFPLPENFPLAEGSAFDVTGYVLPDNDAGERVIEVVSLLLTYLPRSAVLDRDKDLLDDRWELTFLRSMDGEAFGDPDKDGYNNVEEFIQGTDPNSYEDTPGANGTKMNLALRIEMTDDGRIRLRLPIGSVFLDDFDFNPISSDHPGRSFNQEVPVDSYVEGEDQVIIMDKEVFRTGFYRIALNLR